MSTKKRFFNIAGPCVPGKHYMLDPFRGIGDELMGLIGQEQYFVIHAARQSGKTTLLWELTDSINAKGDYYALYCSLEAVREFTEPEKGIPAIVKEIKRCAKNQGLPEGFAKTAEYDDITGVLNESFTDYCRLLDKPLVLFFDEADCLSNGTLVTFLRQLRSGYVSRPRVPFVHSLALVGLRNLRDYTARVRPDVETLGSASPFNIVTESLNLRNFTKMEVSELYAQHTTETGQIFELQTIDYIFEKTQGQPWLVNAVARECVEKICKNDHKIPITQEMAETAVNTMILTRPTHVDSLLRKLKEPRIRKVIEPLILGGETVAKSTDDYLYARDLGLIRDDRGMSEPANPIYAELIVRFLSEEPQESLENRYKEFTAPRYIKNGKMDVDFLISDFQTYWRENSEIWRNRYETELYQYVEAAPHLVMQAFLQKVINSGGKITREMAIGTMRADLCVEYDGHKYPIELKILHNKKSYDDGVRQTAEYMDKVGADKGWLVIFDRDTEKCWDEKIYMKKETVNGKDVVVAGC